jgi:hypothetical protein
MEETDRAPAPQGTGMKTVHEFWRGAVLILGLTGAGLLVFTMAALQIYKKDVFLERGTIDSVAEVVMLAAFLLVFLFDILSVLWLAFGAPRPLSTRKRDLRLLLLGAVCLILFAADKTLVDEIARESRLGWEVLGEWIILYTLLAVQLLYIVLVTRRAVRNPARPRGAEESTPGPLRP